MASVNRVILIGHLGADPEVRYIPSGEAVANISLATTDRWKDKESGEQRERTEWWKVELWGRLGEIAGEHLKKGSLVYVEGSGYTQKWTDRDGNDRYTFKVRANVMQMLGRPNGGEQRSDPQEPKEPPTKRAPAREKTGGKFDDLEDDIPF